MRRGLGRRLRLGWSIRLMGHDEGSRGEGWMLRIAHRRGEWAWS